MAMNRVARRLLVPSISTAVMLAILLSLGTWQIHRLHWKLGVLAQIDAAEARPAIPLPADPVPFTKVRVTGTMRNDLSAMVGSDVEETPEGPRIGAQLVVPLQRPGLPDVLVDRGWVPSERSHRLAPDAGEVTVEGYIRAPEHPGLFSATDDAAMRQFYTFDPAAIGAALGLTSVAPFTLIAMGKTPPEGYPDPAQHLPRPPNDHLSYAITWYGLAVTLVVIFTVYARKVIFP
jgi:surfeit locus 1 family protein